VRRTVRIQRRRDRQTADCRRLLGSLCRTTPLPPVNSLALLLSLVFATLALLPFCIICPSLFLVLFLAARVLGFRWWPTTARTAHVEQACFFNRNEFNCAEPVFGEIGRQSFGLIPVIKIDLIVAGRVRIP
jgi:hypothetical protein